MEACPPRRGGPEQERDGSAGLVLFARKGHQGRPKFRWCTKRLKIDPGNLIVKGIPGQRAVLAGVRYGESAARIARLSAKCGRDGECDQDFWFVRGPEQDGANYLAPIVIWKTCKVWDFLAFVSPLMDWPTAGLLSLYGSKYMRFGCWMCTPIRRDGALETVVERQEWNHLRPLGEFRERRDKESRKASNRRVRPDGGPGALDLRFRRRVLRELLELQEKGKVPTHYR